jgi:nucleotide-binding universal stress UspA family protein
MTIVVGYLATSEGRAALDAALDESRLRDEDLVLVVSQRGDQLAADAEELAAALSGVRAELTGLQVKHEVRTLHGGDVADDILGVAQEVDASLVVLGLRRRSHVGKLILGANAQRVLFDAPCPVLTVKPGPA